MVVFKQLNLNHCIAATTAVGKDNDECIYLLQEPWYNKSGSVGLPKNDYFAANKSRAGIYVNMGICAVPINDFTGPDIATVLLEGGPLKRPLIICSAYMANDRDDPILPLLNDLVEFCNRKNKDLICGIDSNTHSAFWNMTPKNNSESRRADKLEEFIITNNLAVENRGNRPTFVRPHLNQETIIDITISNCSEFIKGWKVSDVTTASDHRLIHFRYTDEVRPPKVEVRNYAKADWTRFQRRLRDFKPPTQTEWSEERIESETQRLHEEIETALNATCPKTKVRRRQSYAWWNEDCEMAHAKYKAAEKKFFKRAPHNRFNDMWEDIKLLRKTLTKVIRKAKRDSWREMVGSVENTSEMSRLNKIINRGEIHKLGLLKKGNGTMTTDTTETLQVLMDEHFPGNIPTSEVRPNNELRKVEKVEWITDQRVGEAIRGFNAHKAAGTDELKPIVLQNFPSNIIRTLTIIYTACIAMGYTPTRWRESVASFIPKPKKGDYTNPRAFRPISLMSFLFKTLERLVCWRNDETAFKDKPLHNRQYAFRKGYSTERAMSDALRIIEKGYFKGEYVVACFLDIKGAFDNITTGAIVKALEKKNVESEIIKWYSQYLNNRVCIAELGTSRRKVKLTKGAPQGGVASPVMAWNCAFDMLLEAFDGLATKILGYADDALLLTTSIDLRTAIDIAQGAITRAEKWARNVGVEFSPEKTAAMIFCRRKDKPYRKLRIYDKDINWVTSTKYLGVIFDNKLTFRQHIEEKIAAARKALILARNAFSKTWGPQPRKTKWLYTGVIRPALTYGSIIWHKAVDNAAVKEKLQRLQRLALLTMANVRKGTPSTAMEIIFDLTPLDLIIKEMAAKAYVRLNVNGIYYDRNSHITAIEKWLGNWQFKGKESDSKTHGLRDRRFCTIIGEGNDTEMEEGKIRCYTDGSRLDNIAGAGAVIFLGNEMQNVIKQNLGDRSVFQAEVQAIKMAAESLQGLIGRDITFRVDNQASIKALGSAETNSSLVYDTYNVLQDLSRSNEVRIEWIRAHVGWHGNELADETAKEGTRMPEIQSEIRPPKRDLWAAIEGITNKKWTKRWESSKICRQTKYFYFGPDKGKSNELLNMTKNKISILTRFLTGHAFLRRQNFIVEHGCYPPKGWASCRLCSDGNLEEDEDETPHHLITTCPALMVKRLESLGHRVLDDKPTWRPLQLAELLEGQVEHLEET